MISAAQRDRVDSIVAASVAVGARVLTGGHKLPGPGQFYAPTVLRPGAAGGTRR
jgi:succinate-semialdehyde dehydrogenase/glutarate-semialdehyde dehydrogenase